MRPAVPLLCFSILLASMALVGLGEARPAEKPGPRPLVAQLRVNASSHHIDELRQNKPGPDPNADLDVGLGRLLNANTFGEVRASAPDEIERHDSRTKVFDWTIHYGDGAPDGFAKRQIMINGQAPGPTIECNEGDTVIVRIKNQMDVGTSIHWHGIFQNSTPYMDGISGFSQCPIPAGGSFEYRFKVECQFGTYWYHSHAAVQYTDGLYGALIVHSPNDPYKQGQDYDEELVLLLADNYHDWADRIAKEMLSPAGYKGSQGAPSPQSALINGRGVYDCSKAEHQSRCAQLKTPTKDVEPGKTYRLRIINAGSHAFNYVSIDRHTLQIIAIDGTPIIRREVHRVPLHNGQRYDALVTMDQGKCGDSFLLRSFIQTECFAVVDDTLDPTGNLTLQYKHRPEDEVLPPKPHDWRHLQSENSCVDLSDDMLTPLIPRSVPDNKNPDAVGRFITGFGFMNLSRTQQVGRFFMNGTTFVDYVNNPLLNTVHRGGSIDPRYISSWTFADDVWVGDLILQNTDVIDHPMHLHGVESHIIGRGSGNMTIEQWQTMEFDTINPPRRDTIVVPQKSWLVLRFFSDNPGVWPLHCHIAFHLAAGFMGAVVVHPGALEDLPFPASVLDLCPTDEASLNQIDIP